MLAYKTTGTYLHREMAISCSDEFGAAYHQVAVLRTHRNEICCCSPWSVNNGKVGVAGLDSHGVSCVGCVLRQHAILDKDLVPAEDSTLSDNALPLFAACSRG